MPGRAIEVSNKCHLCICVIVGVIKCDPIKCPIGGLENAEDENDDNVDSPESEVAVQEDEVEEDDPEPEPTQDSDEPNDSSESVFQKLRGNEQNCTSNMYLSHLYEFLAIEVRNNLDGNPLFSTSCLGLGVIQIFLKVF